MFCSAASGCRGEKNITMWDNIFIILAPPSPPPKKKGEQIHYLGCRSCQWLDILQTSKKPFQEQNVQKLRKTTLKISILSPSPHKTTPPKSKTKHTHTCNNNKISGPRYNNHNVTVGHTQKFLRTKFLLNSMNMVKKRVNHNLMGTCESPMHALHPFSPLKCHSLLDNDTHHRVQCMPSIRSVLWNATACLIMILTTESCTCSPAIQSFEVQQLVCDSGH